MNIGVRPRLSTLGAATALSAALVLGLAGTASAEPVAQPQPALAAAAVTAAVTPVAFVGTDRGRRCERQFHHASWFWGDGGRWDRWYHWQHRRDRHFRPGWWSWNCR
jgi:hypothetical protein